MRVSTLRYLVIRAIRVIRDQKTSSNHTRDFWLLKPQGLPEIAGMEMLKF